MFYLLIEKILYSKKLNKIPLRISVSGTRGKTSIVRTLASVFRSNDIKVLAKTIGSEAKYILPNGKEELIKRRGMTNILEQKKLIDKAVKLKVDCIITEIMSIHPEYHFIETHKLIKPELTIISNFRADHINVAGKSIVEISKLFINDIYPSSKILIHENEINKYIIAGINKNKSELITGKKDVAKGLKLSTVVLNQHISENLDLVFSASKYFGINNKTITKGITNTRLDIGKLEIYKFEAENKKVYFVNSFAANDPYSTNQLIKKTIKIINLDFPKIIGLMSLRSDRGERSQQWLEYLTKNGTDYFNHIFLTGSHSKILNRKIQASEIIKSKNPEHITNHIISESDTDSIIFGIANINGLGKSLVNYWNCKGIKI